MSELLSAPDRAAAWNPDPLAEPAAWVLDGTRPLIVQDTGESLVRMRRHERKLAAGPNGHATAALVFGLSAIFCSVLILPAVLGFVFGRIGLQRAGSKERLGYPPIGRARSIWGLVASCFGLLVAAALVVGAVVVLPFLGDLRAGAEAQRVSAAIADMSVHGNHLHDVVCPAKIAVAPATSAFCSATGADHRRVDLRVHVLDEHGRFVVTPES